MPDDPGDKYLADEDYDDDAARRRSQELAGKICQDMSLFAIFLAAFTIVVLASHSGDSAMLVNRADEIINLRNSSMPMESVRSVDSFWEYTNNFFDGVFLNKTDSHLARLRYSLLT